MKEQDAQERFLKLFLSHRDSLAAFIRVLLRNPSAAEDCLQEASLVLWQKFDTFREGSSFGAWARRIALNKVLKERERLAKKPILMDVEAIESVSDAFGQIEKLGSDDEWKASLRRCMQQLAPAARKLVDLRYFKDLGLREVAEKLSRSVAGVNSALCKARHFLETCIQQVMGKGAGNERA